MAVWDRIGPSTQNPEIFYKFFGSIELECDVI